MVPIWPSLEAPARGELKQRNLFKVVPKSTQEHVQSTFPLLTSNIPQPHPMQGFPLKPMQANRHSFVWASQNRSLRHSWASASLFFLTYTITPTRTAGHYNSAPTCLTAPPVGTTATCGVQRSWAQPGCCLVPTTCQPAAPPSCATPPLWTLPDALPTALRQAPAALLFVLQLISSWCLQMALDSSAMASHGVSQ